MANRISKVTTRTGDDGTTGLGDGSRIHKSHLRVQALGDVDELNSQLGVLRAVCKAGDGSQQPVTGATVATAGANHDGLLARIQNGLFDLGGELCIPTYRAITDQHLLTLDEAINDANTSLPPLKEFILPGGSLAAAHCHVARTVARRAERSVAALMASGEDVSPLALHYLNRLSDLLFILARVFNRERSHPDVFWTREATPAAPAAPAA
ncbi:MAG: cob(I)yrinic acid a,c-diamide adenosyltransferase [Aeromicrobium sp.]|nr:cob(I)yrinic acid a,c-diamide adenosyltransferase [Burkholderiales bacterium]